MPEHNTHAVQLDRDKCVGCTNCIMRCPTGAIRVRDGKARIDHRLCVDCGECLAKWPQQIRIPNQMSRIVELTRKKRPTPNHTRLQ